MRFPFYCASLVSSSFCLCYRAGHHVFTPHFLCFLSIPFPIHHPAASLSDVWCSESIWRIPSDQNQRCLAAVSLLCMGMSSTQIRQGARVWREEKRHSRQGEGAAERPWPYKGEVSFFSSFPRSLFPRPSTLLLSLCRLVKSSWPSPPFKQAFLGGDVPVRHIQTLSEASALVPHTTPTASSHRTHLISYKVSIPSSLVISNSFKSFLIKYFFSNSLAVGFYHYKDD